MIGGFCLASSVPKNTLLSPQVTKCFRHPFISTAEDQERKDTCQNRNSSELLSKTERENFPENRSYLKYQKTLRTVVQFLFQLAFTIGENETASLLLL